MASQADGVRMFGGIQHSHDQIIVVCCVLLAIISFLGILKNRYVRAVKAKKQNPRIWRIQNPE
jgi:hypothetical protein